MDGDEEFGNSAEVASGTFWGLLGNGALKIMSFLYMIYIARAVSQNDIGLFYLAFSIIGLFGAWKTLGLPLSLARYIPFYESKGEDGKARKLFEYSLAINLVVGAALAVLLWYCAGIVSDFYQNPGLPDALRLLAGYVLLENIFSTLLGFLQGRADIKSMQLVTSSQIFFKLVLAVIIFSLYGASLQTLCASFVLSYVFAIAIAARPASRHFASMPEGKGGITASELVREIAPFGLMMTVISIIWTIVSYADRVVLGFLVPPAQANDLIAVYSMAIALGIQVMVFPGTVGGIFLPTISRLVGKNDMGGIRRTMATAQRWVLFITLPFAIVMIAFAQEMLSIFYGSDYGSGGLAMSIFCAGLLFSVFSYVFPLTLAGMRLVSLELKIAAAVLAVNVALCLLFIPQYGINGAAASAAVAFAVSALLFSHYSWKMAGYKSPSEAYRLLASAMLVLALLFAIKPIVASAAGAIPPLGGPELLPYSAKIAYLLLLGVVTAFSFAAFVALSLAAKCFGHEDISVMKSAAKRVSMPPSLIRLAERVVLIGVSGKR